MMAAMERFDLVVIGAGTAGEAATHYAAAQGASVAVIDRDLFGGSCPFWACMPSKALLHAAAVHHAGGDYPWKRASDFRDYMINREGIDRPDDSGHVRALEEAGATVIRGSARWPARTRSASATACSRPTTSSWPSGPSRGCRTTCRAGRGGAVDERPGHRHPRAAEVARHPRGGADRRGAGAGLCPLRRPGHARPSRATGSTIVSTAARPSSSAPASRRRG
jgi:hypothetical protein